MYREEYKILSADSWVELIEAVDILLRLGWKKEGNPFSSDKLRFQFMYKSSDVNGGEYGH